MGQKTHPKGLRLGINHTWDSQWFADKDYADFVVQDIKLREELMKRFRGNGDSKSDAGAARIVISRPSKEKINFTIHVARPGVVIGRKGEEINKLRDYLKVKTGKEVSIDIKEVKIPEIEAKLVAENIAQSLERRVSFRRAMKKAMENALRYGAEGIRVCCSGRLAGAEIARTEWYAKGRVPLHTLKMKIDFAIAEAHTTYGCIGVKVWLSKGESQE